MANQPQTLEISQLTETIRKLETRIAQLERAFSSAGNESVLKVGSSSITLKSTSIEIRSNDITLSASGKIRIQASSDVVLKGSKILQN